MYTTRHSCRSQYTCHRVHLPRLLPLIGHMQADEAAATWAGPVPHFPLHSDWELQLAEPTLPSRIEFSLAAPSLTY